MSTRPLPCSQQAIFNPALGRTAGFVALKTHCSQSARLFCNTSALCIEQLRGPRRRRCNSAAGQEEIVILLGNLRSRETLYSRPLLFPQPVQAAAQPRHKRVRPMRARPLKQGGDGKILGPKKDSAETDDMEPPARSPPAHPRRPRQAPAGRARSLALPAMKRFASSGSRPHTPAGQAERPRDARRMPGRRGENR
jgi:hypothetical protein